MSEASLPGWDRLRHGGLLLDPPRLQTVAALQPGPLGSYHDQELRRQAATLLAGEGEASAFVAFVLERVCGFAPGTGTWTRGSAIGAEWSRRTPTGDTIKPRHLWRDEHGALLPVFLESERQVGIGRGRRTASQVVQWLRAGRERLALLTNGQQWRLIFAGLDFDAWCEWDVDLWFEEGELSPQVQALRTLLSPQAWTPTASDQPGPLLTAVLESRKGQAELSAALGERVREAVELLVQSHGDVLREQCSDVNPADIYRAAVRVVMRLVVVLFAESRDLLPRDNTLYHGAYGVGGLLEELEKTAARGGSRLARSWSAWPRLLALFRLVHQGSHHPALPVPAYGGELFEPAVGGDRATDGLHRALHVFETAAFDISRGVFPDRDVHRMLEKISRTRVKLRQGRQKTWVTVPVDFSDLSSEYIGILYEGLLDFELKTAPSGDPVIFLAVGNQPALPLSRLEEMDDRALAALLEKMKDTSSSDHVEFEGADDASDETEEEGTGYGDEDADDTNEEESVDGEDDRHVTRTRAESWACLAVKAGKLVRRPRASANADTRRAYEESVSRKARQLVVRVVLPGEWYLVRWGGTRKGSGTFYTRPGLAVPTVQRTLRPLLYDPPAKEDGTPDVDAPASAWLPKRPEDILAIKTCDGACGSGTFPVAVLRYITDALYAAVHHHGRVADRGDRSVVNLLRERTNDADDVAALGQELIPCPSEDASFEPRLRAVLKRYVVERCIYGVDLDPLAVELCRLSLWIETMDRSLPFSFLDHKVKCGNALVGTWFDKFLHYPVMAWKNREGGDKNHSNGVHFTKGARGKAFKAFVADKVTPEMRRLLEGRTLLSGDQQEQACAVHQESLALLNRLHELPVHSNTERARIYQEELLGSEEYQSLKSAFDLWCACWFWPAEDLDSAPLPTTLSRPTPETSAIAKSIAAAKRFFHWELEFPDVFRDSSSGFDAVLGNPPWDIAKLNSKEFFSNIDPLYRGLANPELRQIQLFSDISVERDWLNYVEHFDSWSNFIRFSSNPFGDPECTTAALGRFAIARGRANVDLHAAWRFARSRTKGFSNPNHPYRSQGGSDINLYKLFTEQMVQMVAKGGRIGLVLPASVYSDKEAEPLRQILIEKNELQWLFSFENRTRIFPIDSRFRFCCLIVHRGSQTTLVRMGFGKRELSEWAEAECSSIKVPAEDLNLFSPASRSIPELESSIDLSLMRSLFANGRLLGSEQAASWGVKYLSEYHMTQARKAGQYIAVDRAITESMQVRPGHWRKDGQDLVAFYSGKMISQFDFAFQGWVSGHAAAATWEPLAFTQKDWRPEFVSPLSEVRHQWGGGTRLVFRDFARATDERTMIAAVIPAWPCGNKVPVLGEEGHMKVVHQLALCCILNSFSYDFIVRNRITGMNLNKFILDETPVPDLTTTPIQLSVIGARLCMVNDVFAGAWLELLETCPELHERPLQQYWAIDFADRLELRAISEAIVALIYGLNEDQFRWILRDCDISKEKLSELSFRKKLPVKGFWRTGIGAGEHPWRRAWNCDPRWRLTNLSLVAFSELERLKRSLGDDTLSAIAAFAPINGIGGWRIPVDLRQSVYGPEHKSQIGDGAESWQRFSIEESTEQTAQLSWDNCRQIAASWRAIWSNRDRETTSFSVSQTQKDRDVISDQGNLFEVHK
jgi:hypothetical protein